MVLSDPFSGMNSAKIQQSGHDPRFGPEVKDGRNYAKNGAPERLRCGKIQKVLDHADDDRRR